MQVYNYISQNIIDLFNLEYLSDEKKEELILDYVDLLKQRLVERLFNYLDKEDLETFLQYLSNDNDPALFEFLSEKVSNLEEMILEEIDKLKYETMQYLNE